MNRFILALAATLTVSTHAGPTLTDLWEGKAEWVRDAIQIGTNFQFHFPSIRPDGDALEAFYLAPRNNKLTIGRARSVDGLNWANDGTVVDVGRDANDAWDNRMASFPGVWKDGDTWYVVYEGAGLISPGDIGLATSKDGTNFTKHPNNPILRHNVNDWERANIGTPSLYKENGIWYLFYHAYDANVCQIGVATGTNLTNLSKAPKNPLVPVSTNAAAWDTGTTGRRSRIVKEGPYYYFAFEGSTAQPYTESRWSSGLARSTNLTSGWVKCPRNPMIPQTPSGMGYDGPELVRLKDVWYLYVRSPHSVDTERFRLRAK